MAIALYAVIGGGNCLFFETEESANLCAARMRSDPRAKYEEISPLAPKVEVLKFRPAEVLRSIEMDFQRDPDRWSALVRSIRIDGEYLTCAEEARDGKKK